MKLAALCLLFLGAAPLSAASSDIGRLEELETQCRASCARVEGLLVELKEISREFPRSDAQKALADRHEQARHKCYESAEEAQ